MPRALAIKAGDRFGKFTIIKEVAAIQYDARRTRRAFKVKCDCGSKPCVKQLIDLTTGHTKSCGCLKPEVTGNRSRTHGMSKTATYKIWTAMLQRCRDPNHKSYADYGGRGIKVCKRWHKFEKFVADKGERPSANHEIDRIDGNGDYTPSNTRWLDNGALQARNRRKQKNATSQYRGVDWWDGRAWRARISRGNKVRDLGLFDTEEAAARAYDKAARQYKGSKLNFP